MAATPDVLAKKQRIGILIDTAFASAGDASANFKTINADAGKTIPEPDTQVETFNWTSANGITEEEGRIYVDSTSGLPSVNVEGVATWTNGLLKSILALHFQSVSEAATTPFSTTMKYPDAVLDFVNDDGYTASVAVGNYDSGSAGDGFILKHAITDTFNLVIEPNQRGIARLGKFSAKFVGMEKLIEEHFTGTWEAMPTTGFFNTSALAFGLTLTAGATTGLGAFGFRRFELSGNLKVTSDVKTTGGVANNFKLSPELTYTVDIPYNATTYKLLKHYADGDNVSIVLSNGTGTAGQMNFTSTKGVLTANPFIYEGDYQAIRIQGKCLRPTAGWDNLITIHDAEDLGL